MKSKLFLSMLIFAGTVYSQNNLLDTSTWDIGSSYLTNFNIGGSVEGRAMSERVLGIDPHGDNNILWEAKSNPNSTETTDLSGFESSYVSIDSNKIYRVTVWIKKLENDDLGHSYFGLNIKDTQANYSSLRLNGSSNSNPYFWSGNFPTIELNKWFLFVGYVYPETYSGTQTGAIYDPVTGNPITTIGEVNDYKFGPGSNTLRIRCYLKSSNSSGSKQYHWEPTIYEVNGLEPTIEELLNGGMNLDTQSPTSPTLSEMAHTETTVDLSWSGATDNVGVTGYKVYKDGVLHVSLGNQTLYQAKSLSPGTTYDFEVSAIDGQGNESSRSNVVSVTTDSSSGGDGGTTNPIWSESNGIASYAGNVAIGATTVPNGYALAVDGKIISEEVKVQLSGNWPDYVFKEDYKLPTLEEIKKHIDEKGHLPNIPSAEQVKINGVEVGEMNRLLLEKVEELTLYILLQEEILNKQNIINSELLERIEKLEVWTTKNNLKSIVR